MALNDRNKSDSCFVKPVLLALSFLASLAFSEETNITLIVDGVTYSNVTFGAVTPSSVGIRHSTGAASIPLEKLSLELQRRFGYDPERMTIQRKEQEAKALEQTRLSQAARKVEYKRIREANAGDRIKVIPYLGDETPIQKIIADPQAVLGRTFIVCGGVSSRNYYNYNYSYAANTHYSLRFEQLSPDLQPTESLTVYALRSVAKPLVDSITDAQAGGKTGKLLRLKIVITKRSFSYGQFNENAELVDWQVLNPDKATWSPWAMDSKQ